MPSLYRILASWKGYVRGALSLLYSFFLFCFSLSLSLVPPFLCISYSINLYLLLSLSRSLSAVISPYMLSLVPETFGDYISKFSQISKYSQNLTIFRNRVQIYLTKFRNIATKLTKFRNIVTKSFGHWTYVVLFLDIQYVQEVLTNSIL